jgi:hypothetical protein
MRIISNAEKRSDSTWEIADRRAGSIVDPHGVVVAPNPAQDHHFRVFAELERLAGFRRWS